ncbi:2-succinyl-6-hydroxy-2,4-cyclohexadiene-1-carboxylate synthase [Halobacillus rhizosphaerae]|uniref:2-succinyl-6-hydroxy-2, 4-cyclohexadiene-1-carboxylate synthase n=1 Tax=Halobacillus rhizosphaerae TaxID=3064889 RepID=UPI00398B558A
MYVTVNHHTYWIEDEGDGPVLLLFHGFTGSLHTFDDLLERLPDQVRTIRVDMPGHAKTGVIGEVTMEQFCHDVNTLLEQLLIPKVHLLGYSMGGRAALTFTVLYPERVKGLLLESASPGLKSSEEQADREAKDRDLAKMISEEGLEAFVSFWENIPLFVTQRNLSVNRKYQLRTERLQHQKEGLIQSLISMGTGKQASMWAYLKDVSIRVVLVTGTEDQKFVRINKEMQQLLPDSKVVKVQGAGHAVHLEDPEFFAKIVNDFVLQ